MHCGPAEAGSVAMTTSALTEDLGSEWGIHQIGPQTQTSTGLAMEGV